MKLSSVFRPWISFAGVTLALLGVVSTNAATLTVMSNADAGGTCPGPTCTLREAIATALPGDTIDFAGFVGTVNLTSGELLVDKSLTINGPGAKALTVQRSAAAGTPNFRVLEIAAGSANVSIAKLTIAGGNPAGVFPANAGGGIQHNSTGTLSLTGCSIVGNQGSEGGGVYVDTGTLTVSGCTFQGNIATGFDGGGIYNNRTATMNISNSTFTENSSGGNAGGIFNNNGVLTVTNCTIAGNTCESFGGGIANYKTLNLKNSLVAGNAATFDNSAPDIGGAVTSQGYNLIGVIDSSGSVTPAGQTGDQIGTPGAKIDPKLSPSGLQDNGGGTRTIALQASSSAVNAGDPAAPPRDQRGYLRQGTPDIGAFEVGATIPVALGNLSTRGFVGTGDNVLIGGVIIIGSGPKAVLFRAIGPSMSNPPTNLGGTLADPTLSLYDSSGTRIGFNDNWADAPNSSSIPPGLGPANSNESSILTTLAPGAYTAVVRGAGDTTGIALAEGYDLDNTAGSTFGNISGRSFVGTGNNVLIAGVIVTGPDSKELVIRGLGPSLGPPPFNLVNVLQDPFLDLRDANGNQIGANDSWKSTQRAQIEVTGLAPTSDAEAAIRFTLAPGNYTAILSGIGSATGNALLEIFGLN